MSSIYNGDDDNFSDSLTLMTGGDTPSAQLFRVPLERLLDNTATLNAGLVREVSRDRIRSALRMRPLLPIESDDTSEFMAAAAWGETGSAPSIAGVVLVKCDSLETWLAYDGVDVNVNNAVASITSNAIDAANNGSRVVVIGTGGALGAYTDNAGGSWDAVVAGIGGAVQRIIYASNIPTGGRFICGGSGTGSVYVKANVASGTWVSTASGFAAPLALAALFSGRVVVLGASGTEPRFSTSDNPDVSFTTQAATVPNASDADEAGDLQGADLSPLGGGVYHIMRCDAGDRIRTASSADGETWTAGTVILPPQDAIFASRPRLLMCQQTGLLVIAARCDNGAVALYASLDFVDWVGPCLQRDVVTTAFALAGGKLYMTRDGAIYGSEGIRY